MRAPLAALLLLTASCATTPKVIEAGPEAACAPVDSDLAFLQATVALWEFASHRYFPLKDRPLPWTVFFDERCAYHLNADPLSDPALTRCGTFGLVRFRGEELPLRARPHEGGVRLPNGAQPPVSPIAFASIYRPGGKPSTFFTLALLSIWKGHAPDSPHLAERMVTVGLHEFAHTQQLIGLLKHLNEIPDVPEGLNDDIVQTRLGTSTEYETAFRGEVDLLYRAAFAEDLDQTRTLAKLALDSMRARHAKFFVGEQEILRKLEPLFLHLEGTGEWVRARVIADSAQLPDGFGGFESFHAMPMPKIVAFLRGKKPDWVQDHGLALYLVIDRLLPAWAERSFGDRVPSPYELLEEGLKHRRE